MDTPNKLNDKTARLCKHFIVLFDTAMESINERKSDITIERVIVVKILF